MPFILMISDRQRRYDHKAASRSPTAARGQRYESRIEFMIGSVKKMFIQSNLGNIYNYDTDEFDVLLDHASRSFVGKDRNNPHHAPSRQSSYSVKITHIQRSPRSQPLVGLTS